MSDEYNQNSGLGNSQQQPEPLLTKALPPRQAQNFTNPQDTTENIKYAGFWLRFLAVFIDGIILALAFYIIQTVTGIELMQSYSANENPIPQSGMGSLIGFFINISYMTITTGSPLQATLGKKALGLRVIRSDGSEITYLRAFGRFWATIVSYIILFIGYIMAAFTNQKKALHDMIADTRVVYASSLE
jgi:uncharacterized RDD family membrane protein YckC